MLLVEATWVNDLLNVAVESGGYPVAYGCMEPETALVFGAHLAAAAESIASVERAKADRARVALDTLAREGPVWSSAADFLTTLVTSGVLEVAAVEDAIAALPRKSLIATTRAAPRYLKPRVR